MLKYVVQFMTPPTPITPPFDKHMLSFPPGTLAGGSDKLLTVGLFVVDRRSLSLWGFGNWGIGRIGGRLDVGLGLISNDR